MAFQKRQELKAAANGGRGKVDGVKKWCPCLTELQLDKLASIGCRLSTKKLDFATRVLHLKEYARIHGHTQVPVKSSDFCKLGKCCIIYILSSFQVFFLITSSRRESV
jgi:hypothetical protein